jgi:tetratricopeptide (TPR) repeat protein
MWRGVSTRVLLSLCLVAVGGCGYFKNSKSAIEEAELALAEGDEARAEKIYRDAMRSKGKDSVEARALLINMLINRGGRLLEGGKPEDAMGHYREALALDPRRPESRIAYARALMKVERFTEAIDVLMDGGKECRGCSTMISVIYVERGQAAVRDGQYADALTDFDLALSMNRDPMTVLAKVDVYTQGSYGTGMEAVGYLDHALALMPPDQVGAQQVWWEKRTAVIYTAALAHDDAAISAALAFEDPRRNAADEQRVLDRLNLAMYAASLQIYATDFDFGIARGLRTYDEADGVIEGAPLAALRETLMGLFMQRVSLHLSVNEINAARTALAQALALDPENRMLNFQNVLATAERSSGPARQMLEQWAADPEYTRMRTLVELANARRMMGIGQFTAAAAALERAEKLAPDLLDTRLVRAEIEVETRFEGLKKVWAERFREIGAFSYPGGRINNYGRALAIVRDIQSKYDDAAARDYLRTPGFEQRLAALEKRITAFYPYDAELAPPDKAMQATLLLVREEDGELEVKVLGPTADQVVKVPGPGQQEVVLAGPGLAIVDAPGGYRPVFAEPGVKISVKI